MNTTVASKSWVRKSLVALIVLGLIAPVFGWASGVVGYAEPIDVAAEQTGAADEATGGHGLFPDYSVPGLGSGVGTLLSALVGITITLGVALAAGRLLEE
jgi:cobalt/nickel transport protein